MSPRYPTHDVIRGVFFDWGNTLVAWKFDPELFVEGHVRGLAAFGAGAPSQQDFTDAYSSVLLPLLVGDREDEVDYEAEVAALLASLGAGGDEDAVSRFVVAENRVWRPKHHLDAAVVGVIDSLRADGLKVGLISNAFDPPALMRELFAEIGLLGRLDAIALSAEVGKRKPHALMFATALEQAGVAPGEAVMVGDRLREDVAGAQALGMATVRARWFADDDSAAVVPDAIADSPADVLRWLGAT
jgi:HAD superfamily hydrolase (TIGR01509 family)